MTLPLREQHKNDADTTLNGAINNSVTSITVTTGSVFPSTGNFRVMVDSEIMIVTARSSNTLTVVRGQDGTSAASHSDLADIAMIYSSQGLTRLFQDQDGLFGYSSRKPVGLIVQDDGATVMTSSDFTWINQSTSTVTDRGGTILLNIPKNAGLSFSGMERTAPSTPYTYIFGMRGIVVSGDTDSKTRMGVAFRETSSGKWMAMYLVLEKFFENGLELCISRMSSSTSLFSSPAGPSQLLANDNMIWFKLENDGTNTKFYVSNDGIEFIQFLSESKTAYFSSGPDRIVFFGANSANNGTGSTEMKVELAHWSKGE